MKNVSVGLVILPSENLATSQVATISVFFLIVLLKRGSRWRLARIFLTKCWSTTTATEASKSYRVFSKGLAIVSSSFHSSMGEPVGRSVL